MSDKKLEYIISRLRQIPHVEIVRLGTRTPVVCPQRITPELCDMLKKYHPVWINTHFNHPNEVTAESRRACEMLANAGIPLGNQSVLLRGVNDCVHVMKNLVHELVKMRVRPYYIYQCDLSMGLEHFRTPVSKGIEIIEGLRGHTSGFCIPTFVVDAPGGGGKTPVMPQYVISQAPGKVVLRNFEGVITTYTEPTEYHSECNCPECQAARAKEHHVAELVNDVGAQEGDVGFQGLLKEVVLAVHIHDLLAVGHDGAKTRGSQHAAETCTVGADALCEGALRDVFHDEGAFVLLDGGLLVGAMISAAV